jgi:hypothetical protein
LPKSRILGLTLMLVRAGVVVLVTAGVAAGGSGALVAFGVVVGVGGTGVLVAAGVAVGVAGLGVLVATGVAVGVGGTGARVTVVVDSKGAYIIIRSGSARSIRGHLQGMTTGSGVIRPPSNPPPAC